MTALEHGFGSRPVNMVLLATRLALHGRGENHKAFFTGMSRSASLYKDMHWRAIKVVVVEIYLADQSICT